MPTISATSYRLDQPRASYTYTFPVPWFDVTDASFGAFGNGSHDDTNAIQTAIDTCGLAGGGVVYLPDGVYMVTGLTLTRDDVHLRGSGIDSATIKAISTMTGHLIEVTADYCSIRDVSLDGDGYGEDCLRLTGADRFTGDHLYIFDAGGSGIYVAQSGAGDSAHASLWSMVYIIDCADYGVFLGAGGYDSEWSQLWIGQCGVGLRIESGAQTFSTLHVWGCTGNGVEVRADANRFSNVYLETNGTDGIDIFDARYNGVVGGVLRGNTVHGASTSGTSERNRFVGLAVYDNGSDGILLSSGSDHTVISACQFFDTQSPKTQTYGITASSGSSGIQIAGVSSPDSAHLTGGYSLSAGTAVLDLTGSGSPEGAVTAPIGSTYRRTNGGASTSFYVKESGTGNTGWVGK